MKRRRIFFLGMLTGAATLYLMDPERGRQRRARAREQMMNARQDLEELRDVAGTRARDLRDRARGLAAETRAKFQDGTIDDPTLGLRVRAALGHLVTNPTNLRVTADHGRVELDGTVPAAELDALLSGVGAVRGVREVINRVDAQGYTGVNQGDGPSDNGF